MGLATKDILDAVVSHALTLGFFEKVNLIEPTVPGRQGLEAAVWFTEVIPVQTSGLNSTSVRMTFNIRIYSLIEQVHPDALDINLVEALDALMINYNADFTLGGLVRCVDILGQAGDPLSATSGYLPVGQEQPEIRIVDITLPLIINDVWEQED